MEYAVEYFTRKEVENIGLYVETKNKVAISFYEKYGFKKKFDSWHYWIDEDQFKEIQENHQVRENCNLRILLPDDFDEIVKTFPDINSKELKVHLDKPKSRGLSGGKSIPLGLYYDNILRVYGRFNPEFPGCRPFLITDVNFVDDFIKELMEYKKEDYLRLTFDRSKDLSKFFEEKRYRLHHHMFVMEKEM